MHNKKEIILPFREKYAWYFEERYMRLAREEEEGHEGRMSFSAVFDQSTFIGDQDDIDDMDEDSFN